MFTIGDHSLFDKLTFVQGGLESQLKETTTDSHELNFELEVKIVIQGKDCASTTPTIQMNIRKCEVTEVLTPYPSKLTI